MAPPPVNRPPTVILRRREPTQRTTYYPEHYTDTSVPLVDMGDPFNARNIVHPGDFFTVGKVKIDPGVHLNLYQNIRGIHAVAEKFWGFIAPRMVYRQNIAHPRGVQRSLGADVNIDTPRSVTHGELATVQGDSGTTIKGVAYA